MFFIQAEPLILWLMILEDNGEGWLQPSPSIGAAFISNYISLK